MHGLADPAQPDCRQHRMAEMNQLRGVQTTVEAFKSLLLVSEHKLSNQAIPNRPETAPKALRCKLSSL